MIVQRSLENRDLRRGRLLVARTRATDNVTRLGIYRDYGTAGVSSGIL
jgi:hypothetical protein